MMEAFHNTCKTYDIAPFNDPLCLKLVIFSNEYPSRKRSDDLQCWECLSGTRVNNLLVNIDTDYEFVRQMRSLVDTSYDRNLNYNQVCVFTTFILSIWEITSFDDVFLLNFTLTFRLFSPSRNFSDISIILFTSKSSNDF